MRQHDANQIVRPGFYWNWKTRKLTTIEGIPQGSLNGPTGPQGSPEALPGAPGTKFVRIPTLAFFGLAPFLGALYVLFLPVIGLAMLLHHLADKLRPPTDPAPTTQALRRAERPS